MEYKLNKIDTEIRNAINEQTAEGRIHAKRNAELNSKSLKEKDTKEGQKQKEKEKFNISKYVKSKRQQIEVRAYKSEAVEIQVEKEEDNNSDKGLFIDIRR